jgi:pimeloyl-ACP methyl ester carboxylesterase
MAPRAETFLASRAARTAAFGHLLHRPANLPPALAAEASRALAGAYWFDDTLAAITRERFIGGEQIRVPVTIAWAEHDRVLLPRQARRAVGEIPGARLLTLRGCGHVATFDDPDQVSQVLLESSRATAGSVVSTVAHG